MELHLSHDASNDEQIIPCSERFPVRQRVPSKPNPVCLKYFTIASPDGLDLNLVIYVGKGTPSDYDMREFNVG